MAIFQYIGRRVRRKVLNKRVFPLVALLIIAIITLPFVCVDCASYVKEKINSTPPHSKIALNDPTINWTKFAYVQYVTSPADLCKAVMLFSQLHEVYSKGLRILLYPSDWAVNANKLPNGELQKAHIARLLRFAVSEFNVVLKPTDILRQGSTRLNWGEEHTKFLGYNLTQFDRVITFGFDSMVSHSMDELFLLPPTPLAMPYVYWNKSTGWGLSDQIMVIQPSPTSFQNIEAAIASSPPDTSALKIARKAYKDTIVRIPQRPYHLLTQEFTVKDREHDKYLGSSKEKWDPRRVLLQARLVHFFDPPLPDPWSISNATWREHIPRCLPSAYRRSDCTTSSAWAKFYSDYQNRRMNVCGVGFEP